MLGVYPSRTGSWTTPQELAGLVGRWMECENEIHKTWGCFLKKMPLGGKKKKLTKINHSHEIAKYTIRNIRLYHNIPRSTEGNTLLTGAQNQDQHISAPS